jgi:hypothetical protein
MSPEIFGPSEDSIVFPNRTLLILILIFSSQDLITKFFVIADYDPLRLWHGFPMEKLFMVYGLGLCPILSFMGFPYDLISLALPCQPQ